MNIKQEFVGIELWVKILLVVLILLIPIGFYAGTKYKNSINLENLQQILPEVSQEPSAPSPTATPVQKPTTTPTTANTTLKGCVEPKPTCQSGLQLTCINNTWTCFGMY